MVRGDTVRRGRDRRRSMGPPLRLGGDGWFATEAPGGAEDSTGPSWLMHRDPVEPSARQGYAEEQTELDADVARHPCVDRALAGEEPAVARFRVDAVVPDTGE